jgi:hypothetical protein
MLAKVLDGNFESLAVNMESNAANSEDLQAMVQNQLAFQSDVKGYVERRMAKMMVELNNVPLLNKDSESWNKFVTNFANGLAR